MRTGDYRPKCMMRMSDEWVTRLRAIVVAAPNLERCARMLGSSVESVQQAITGGPLRPSTVEKIQAGIEAFERAEKARAE